MMVAVIQTFKFKLLEKSVEVCDPARESETTRRGDELLLAPLWLPLKRLPAFKSTHICKPNMYTLST
jgi:hypothetical protein